MRYRFLPRVLPLFAVIAFAALTSGTAPAHGASFTVNATHDAVDAAPGDGVCADATGACTLRAAVMETNALPGADTVSMENTLCCDHALTISGAGEDGAASGDLDVTTI
jgi:trimeric autotransporter adhesin